MNIKQKLLVLSLVLSILSCKQNKTENSVTITELKSWLESPAETRALITSLAFAKTPISQEEADLATQLLFKEKQKQLSATYGEQWANRLISIDTLQMPVFLQTFGEAPEDGRSLFISMHGGGNAPPEVNDQQYQNQQHLYDAKMASMEGVYLAARAPTNTWDLWHQSHIDDFFNIIIQLAVIYENVNPNKVYLLGYSAGGDGVYQLAPRMGDRWAAAGMMAGHPNETSAVGLRNTPFALQMGALDTAFNRNKIAEEWAIKLDSLQALDPNGYQHLVTIHENKGHWMDRQDSIALPWMAKHKRNPIPNKVVWKQDNTHHTTFFWLKTPEPHIKTGGEIKASYSKRENEVVIHTSYTDTLSVRLNDHMLDLNKPVRVLKGNTLLFEGNVHRTISAIYDSMSQKGDKYLSFPVTLSIVNNTVEHQ